MTRAITVLSGQDTLTGHQKSLEQGQADEYQYVTIQQAAQHCGVSSKTIQRAITARTLPAYYPHKNRCAIAVSDLVRLRSGHVSGHSSEPLERRVAALEERVRHLEHLMATLQNQSARPPSRKKGTAEVRTTGPLPKQLVSLLAFAELHSVAESRVRAHAEMRMLPALRGAWTATDGTPVSLALDEKGRTAFFQIYQGVPPFVFCQHCPHEAIGHVSGQD